MAYLSNMVLAIILAISTTASVSSARSQIKSQKDVLSEVYIDGQKTDYTGILEIDFLKNKEKSNGKTNEEGECAPQPKKVHGGFAKTVHKGNRKQV